ncbi:DnaB-like helicase C-terminal domain-containing protein [Streptomyces sp. NPDC006259]|uniref:DnaB-like helicase C-terminal domain-containing protein n=1 Tax=Streptomyces sp. NPDC006259 TaxID=3364740 RepID=UPI0036906AEE
MRWYVGLCLWLCPGPLDRTRCLHAPCCWFVEAGRGRVQRLVAYRPVGAALAGLFRFSCLEILMSARSAVPEPSAAEPTAQGTGETAHGGAAAALMPVEGPEVLGVTEARNRLYELVDAARDEGRVTVIVKRDGKTHRTYRAALIPVDRLDGSGRMRLERWPSWARTAARPKLGDRVMDAAGRPGMPQVLLDRMTPVAVLVDATLVPPGDVPVAVPPGDASGAVPVGVAPAPAPAWADAAQLPSGVSAAPLAPEVAGKGESAAAGEAAAATGRPVPASAADMASPTGQEAGRTTASATAAEAAPEPQASMRAAEAPATAPAAGGGRRRLHGLGEVAGLALTEAVAPVVVPRFGFGLRALDAVLGSLPVGVLTVVAAEPYAGGSLLAVHAARHTALTHGLPVLYAASGLSRMDVAMRVVAAEGGLDYRRLRTGDLTADEQQAAAVVQARLAAADLHVDDGTGLTAELIAETAPYVDGLALVVVDRFQQAADPFVPLSGSALPEAARVLAHLARSRNVPVVAVLDTTDAEVLAGLDAAYLTLTLTRTDNDAHVMVSERDFGELVSVPLRADLASARFADAPVGPQDVKAAYVFGGAEGEQVTAGPDDTVRASLEAHAGVQEPDDVHTVLSAALEDTSAPGSLSGTATPAAATSVPPATGAAPAAMTSPAAGAAPGVALQPAAAHQSAPAAPDPAVGEGFATAEAELLDAALPFTSGARHGLSARLNGVLAALREASTTPGRAGELPGLREILDGLAARRPLVPSTPEGVRLGAALAAFTATRRTAPTTVPVPVASAALQQAPVPGTPQAGPTPAGTPDLAVAEAELLAAAGPFLTGNEHRSALSVHGQHVLAHLRDALAAGHVHLLPDARARAAELGARRLRLPQEPAAERLRAALTVYHQAATAAGITPQALPAPAPAPVPAAAPPTASLTVTEPASAAEPTADAEAAGAAPGAAEESQAADPARRVVEGVVTEAPSASFSDDTPPAEGTPGTGGRNYTFFLNKIRDAVEQALDEANGDVDAAITALKKKAVPDSMALFKLTRVGANYVHTVYPPALDFLSKPGQGEADGIWEGRHKWRNAPLHEAIRKGARDPLDVFGLDTNAAYLSAFKTHLPIGALKHDPTGGFDRRRAGVHRVDHFEWPHEHLPSPIGNRKEPGPYLLDEATVRLLIRCHELELSEAPRILESWTSGASEALLEKFRRVLQQARQMAIEKEDSATEEYVKAMYSRFTSTIGESGKNRELRRPEWVHTIRSQAFASLWLKGWKAHQAGLILVQVSGVDELHVAGGDWKTVWEEGRKPTQMKVKRLYTLGGN